MHLARHGVDSVLTYHANQAEAAAAVAEIEALGRRAVALQLDTGASESFAGFRERFKASLAEFWGREHFDFLVNNAGIGSNAPIAETTEANFDRLVNIHFKGVFFLTQKL